MAKNTLLVSPVTTLKYGWLQTPNTKFNKDGVFEATVECSIEDGKELAKQIKTIADNYVADLEKQGKKCKSTNVPYIKTEDGQLSFKAKLNKVGKGAKGEFTNVLSIVDKYGKPYTSEAIIGSGSKVKIAFEVVPYGPISGAGGVSLRLKAVQILELVEYTGSTGAVFGVTEDTPVDATEEETTFDF